MRKGSQGAAQQFTHPPTPTTAQAVVAAYPRSAATALRQWAVSAGQAPQLPLRARHQAAPMSQAPMRSEAVVAANVMTDRQVLAVLVVVAPRQIRARAPPAAPIRVVVVAPVKQTPVPAVVE